MPRLQQLPPGLPEARHEIDQVDAEIIRLLAIRLGIVLRAASIKRAVGMPFRDEEREEEIFLNAAERAEDLGLPPKQVTKIFRQVLRISAKSQAGGD